MKARLDPELKAPLQSFLDMVGGALRLDNIPAVRAGMQQRFTELKNQLPPDPAVNEEDRRIPGPTGAPDVAVRIYRPTRTQQNLPALLWIHGGGYVMGTIDQDHIFARHTAATLQCVVVSVEYRLSPDVAFPGPLDDCYAALTWLAAHSAEFGVDKNRIAIGGASAGGGLAAGLVLLARDRAQVPVAFQLLIYPMLDDRNIAPASATVPDTLLWSRENNLVGWRSYLGREPGGNDVSSYAAAARATDLKGLPPTFIAVGELDLFLHEDIDYAQRLLRADIATELHVYPGAFHGFDGIAVTAALAKQLMADRDRALQRALSA